MAQECEWREVFAQVQTLSEGKKKIAKKLFDNFRKTIREIASNEQTKPTRKHEGYCSENQV